MEKEFVVDADGAQPTSVKPEEKEAQPNMQPSVRHASDEQFKKAQAKTGKLHAGLFRRLAQ